MVRRLAVIFLLSTAFAAAATARADAAWNVLADPIDPRQQTTLSFGSASHWLQPWRAYLDTVPGTTLRSALGIQFNVPAHEAEATATVLQQAGFRRARIEIPWSDLSFEDPSRFREGTHVERRFRALEAHGLRPLILLNANHQAPGPTDVWTARLVADAPAGARTVQVDAETAQRIVPGRSGLDRGDGKAADVLFTSVEAGGTVTLSKPLAGPLPAGARRASTLRHEPFAYPYRSHATGERNAAFEATLRGWLAYVDVVADAAVRVFGRDGFDMEIWNERTFGSDFLTIEQYYAPVPPHLDGDRKWEAWGEILERTVQWIRRPGRGLERVGVANGFVNQSPWGTAANSPAGQTALSKHPYMRPLQFPDDREFRRHAPYDADGKLAGRRDDATGHWRASFIPRYRAYFPEYWLTALQTEHLVRDVSPITTDIYGTEHGRAARAPHVGPQQVWITETGLDPTGGRPGLSAQAHREALTKSILRSLVAHVSKGVRLVTFYGARDPRLGLLDERFFAADGPRDLAAAGDTLAAVRRLTTPFAASKPLRKVRPLALHQIADRHNHAQFAGDGTAAHPPLHNREVVTFFPFQVTGRRWVVPTYVMTRDITTPLAPEEYRLTFSGAGRRVRVSAIDPLTGRPVRVRREPAAPGRVTVRLALTDSPRLLLVEERRSAPVRSARR